MSTELEALDIAAADIAQKEAQLRAAQAAAAADESKLIEALGIATADNDHKATTLLEKQLGDARNVLQRIVAGLGVLGQRKAATEAQRRAAALAAARVQFDANEKLACQRRAAALAAAVDLIGRLDDLREVGRANEELEARWSNDLERSKRFSSYHDPDWRGALHGWVVANRELLATAPQ